MSMNSRHLPGFTLVETLVAISVITFAIIGPFHIVQSVLGNSYTARDQLIASALAQEGVEYVRSVRDSNAVYNIRNAGSRPWLYGVDNSTGIDCYNHACVVDLGQQTAAQCGSTCPALNLSASNLYTQAAGTATKFTRTVQLTSISATETRVTVTVTWTSHGTYSVVLSESLRNWL